MADVFISYSSKEKDFAATVAENLASNSLTSWWDHALENGRSYDAQIETQLFEARRVLVIWSKNSISSTWVRSEATIANRASKLASVRIDDIELPPPFTLIQSPVVNPASPLDQQVAWTELVGSIRAGHATPLRAARDQTGVGGLSGGRFLIDERKAGPIRFDAYLSCTAVDQQIAHSLPALMRASVVGSRRGRGFFGFRPSLTFANRGSFSGAALGQAFDQGIRYARKMIVVCTPAAAENRWLDHEIDVFAQMRGSANVIPVVFDGEPLTESGHECIPRRLRYQVDVNGAVTDVPQSPFMIDFRDNRHDAARLLKRVLVDDGRADLAEYARARRRAGR